MMDNTQFDFVAYDKETKEILAIVFGVNEENTKFVINVDCVGIVVPHNEYAIENINGVGYFKSLNNIIYLDDYRGRYVD